MSGRARPFLTARFEHLTLFTWAVPQEALAPRLPAGVELDLRRGQAWLSLVTLDFTDTRVLGVPWPGFRAFPDVNLRFYVRKGERRGVVFVRELVPLRFVALCARVLYGEPFDAAEVASVVKREPGRLRVERAIGYRGGIHVAWVEADPAPVLPPVDGDAVFFMEREWGFARARDGATTSTRVVHPPWQAYPVRRAWLGLEWARVYGPEWAFLEGREPEHVALARGSEVTVYRPTRE